MIHVIVLLRHAWSFDCGHSVPVDMNEGTCQPARVTSSDQADNSIRRSCWYSALPPAQQRAIYDDRKYGDSVVATSRRADSSNLTFLIAPFNEQRRIVAKIEELFSDLDAGVAALERVKAKLKRYRAAVLKAAVEGQADRGVAEEEPAEGNGPAVA